MFNDFYRLTRFVKVPWKQFIAGLVLLCASVLTNGASLGMVVPLVDRIFSRQAVVLPRNLPLVFKVHLEGPVARLNALSPSSLLSWIILAILCVIILRNVLFYLQRCFLEYSGSRMLTDIRRLLYVRIVHLPLSFFSHSRSGELTSRIIYDVGLLRAALTENIPQLIYKSGEAIIYLFLIFVLDWKLALAALLIVPLLLLPVRQISQKLRKLSRTMQESYGEIGNIIHESVYGQQIIKAYTQEQRLIRRFGAENETILKTVMAIIRRTAAIPPFTEIMGTAAACTTLFLGSRKVIVGDMSSGFLLLFLAALFSLINPLKAVGSILAELRQASAVLPRIFTLISGEQRETETGTAILSGVRETISFEQVSFSYEARPVLRDVSFTLRAGEKIGIAGRTGSGKTTLVRLLLRLYEPGSGRILFDGADVKTFTLASVRRACGFVTQEPLLFYDTIARNIALEDEPDREAVKRAAATARADGFIAALPHGYETVIGERGHTLSGGQKQLLTIARAVYRNPPLLILDEATASLDNESENLLQEALERVMKGRTVIMIAHRLSTIRNLDRILVLENGRLAEEGRHEQLLALNGVYATLWNAVE